MPLNQLLELMQQFLGHPESGLLNLEAHCLALATARKTLDENCFKTVQKTTDMEPPSSKIGDRVYLKIKQPGKWDLNGDLDTELSVLSMMDITCSLKIRLLEKQSLLSSIVCMIALINTIQVNQESVLFHPVLKAYSTHHSWIITTHVSFGNLEMQRKMFTRQIERA